MKPIKKVILKYIMIILNSITIVQGLKVKNVFNVLIVLFFIKDNASK